jgi:hypothetical protein
MSKQSRQNITQPDAWLEAWKAQAKKEKKNLSQWIGEKCNAGLPKRTAGRLVERRGPGRVKTESAD